MVEVFRECLLSVMDFKRMIEVFYRIFSVGH